jgi:hypothetical protein
MRRRSRGSGPRTPDSGGSARSTGQPLSALSSAKRLAGQVAKRFLSPRSSATPESATRAHRAKQQRTKPSTAAFAALAAEQQAAREAARDKEARAAAAKQEEADRGAVLMQLVKDAVEDRVDAGAAACAAAQATPPPPPVARSMDLEEEPCPMPAAQAVAEEDAVFENAAEAVAAIHLLCVGVFVEGSEEYLSVYAAEADLLDQRGFKNYIAPKPTELVRLYESEYSKVEGGVLERRKLRMLERAQQQQQQPVPPVPPVPPPAAEPKGGGAEPGLEGEREETKPVPMELDEPYPIAAEPKAGAEPGLEDEEPEKPEEPDLRRSSRPRRRNRFFDDDDDDDENEDGNLPGRARPTGRPRVEPHAPRGVLPTNAGNQMCDPDSKVRARVLCTWAVTVSETLCLCVCPPRRFAGPSPCSRSSSATAPTR